ncbi:MAG: winged helix-turn-helix transcriptional regulator [Chloroflexota bacterium]|nr:winged helix-turn-helix transcriptional regulator [Chloroflexota bacterium]
MSEGYGAPVLDERETFDPTRSEAVAAKYFRVLGDPLRLAVLRLLGERGELSVEDIRRALGCKQARLSNQLACLRWCDFVTTRRDGNRIYYSISEPTIPELLRLADLALRNQAERIAACTRVEG